MEVLLLFLSLRSDTYFLCVHYAIVVYSFCILLVFKKSLSSQYILMKLILMSQCCDININSCMSVTRAG